MTETAHAIPRTTVGVLGFHNAPDHPDLESQRQHIARIRKRSVLDVLKGLPKVTPEYVVETQKQRIENLLKNLDLPTNPEHVDTIFSNGKEFQELKPPVFITAKEMFRRGNPDLVQKMELGDAQSIKNAQIEFRDDLYNYLYLYAWDVYHGDPAEKDKRRHLERLGLDLFAGDCMNTLSHALGRSQDSEMIKLEYECKSFAFNSYWEGNNDWPGKKNMI